MFTCTGSNGNSTHDTVSEFSKQYSNNVQTTFKTVIGILTFFEQW